MRQPTCHACWLLLCLMVGSTGGCVSRGSIDYVIQCDYSVADEQFAHAVGSLLGPPLTEGNNIVALSNGDQIFPAMLEAIGSAERTITFETYIYWPGTVGDKFTRALCERAKAGVKVHLIIDAVGSDQITDADVKCLRDAGVEVEKYERVHWYNPSTAARLNHRTHRKLLIIDGKIGFTGGVGIADKWDGNATDPDHWRDMHYRVEGPVVAHLQAAFVDNWIKATGRVLHNADYFPALAPVGKQRAQVFKSDANGGSESMSIMFLLSISAAKSHIRIGNAYFVPDALTVQAIIKARQRGVRVQVIVPGPELDVEIVRAASRIRWGKLLEHGVEIYEFQPTMYHTKLMIVDDLWVSVGSANLDNRSFRLNDEANLNVLDAAFAAEQIRVFEDDLEKSIRYTHEKWKNRPLIQRISEGIGDLLSPLL